MKIRPGKLLFALFLVFPVLCVLQIAGASPAAPAAMTKPAPEDVLAAAIKVQDIGPAMPQRGSWWPEFPEFNVGFSADLQAQLPGEQFFIVQKYQQVGQAAKGRLENALTLFADGKTAAQGFAAMAASVDAGGQAVKGPQAGDECRYSLAAAPDQVLEVVLFTFPDNQAAAAWVGDFIDESRKLKTLDPGKTGAIAAFRFGKENYELQFAQGRFAGDVSGFAPYGKTSPPCENAVRRLAEQWFTSLAGKK